VHHATPCRPLRGRRRSAIVVTYGVSGLTDASRLVGLYRGASASEQFHMCRPFSLLPHSSQASICQGIRSGFSSFPLPLEDRATLPRPPIPSSLRRAFPRTGTNLSEFLETSSRLADSGVRASGRGLSSVPDAKVSPQREQTSTTSSMSTTSPGCRSAHRWAMFTALQASTYVYQADFPLPARLSTRSRTFGVISAYRGASPERRGRNLPSGAASLPLLANIENTRNPASGRTSCAARVTADHRLSCPFLRDEVSSRLANGWRPGSRFIREPCRFPGEANRAGWGGSPWP
jgi:hypothetical protein